MLANASRFKTLNADQVEQLLKELNEQIGAAMRELGANDRMEDLFDSLHNGQSADRLPESLRDMQSRQAQLEAVLTKLREMEKHRRKDGIDPKKNPAQLPATDPDSRILPNCSRRCRPARK